MDYYGTKLATCSTDRSVKIFDVRNGQQVLVADLREYVLQRFLLKYLSGFSAVDEENMYPCDLDVINKSQYIEFFPYLHKISKFPPYFRNFSKFPVFFSSYVFFA